MLIYNSQSRKKEPFAPLDPAGKLVRMYVCGPTVYDSLHLGHARAAITPDIVRRHLEFKGYQIRYVMNFTDIDDKIIKRAQTENRDWRQMTQLYIDEFHAISASLNIKPADVYPKATENIPEMIEIVQRLLDSGHAYSATDGDVYFDTTKYDRYGALSGRQLEDDEAGLSGRISEARLSVKRHAGDFVLWKLSKPGEPFWDSPWGAGRPGWHLECSAMSRKYLGIPFDIHGGGQDLLFPHHEDEKAQTECAYAGELHGRETVRYWVHNGFITLNQQKMSKSLGNVRWLREMIWPEGTHDPMTIRMVFLSSHYRAPVSFEPGLFDEAAARLDRIYNALEALERACAAESSAPPAGNAAAHTSAGNQADTANAGPDLNAGTPAGGSEGDRNTILALHSAAQATMEKFTAAMDDDFNTAGALGEIFDLVAQTNKAVARKDTPYSAAEKAALRAAKDGLVTLLGVLGLRTQRASRTSPAAGDDSAKLIDLLLHVRQEVRAAKLYALGDKIRAGLRDIGYEIEDLPGGKWAVKKKG